MRDANPLYKFSWTCPRCGESVGLRENEIQWEYISSWGEARKPSEANRQVLNTLIALHLDRHRR